MGVHRIEIDKEFSVPVSRLFAYLAEHENLAVIFWPVRIRRLSDGRGARNGVGSSRELSLGVLSPFVETITAYRRNKLIEYRITEGSPLRSLHGVMSFSAIPGGSHLNYSIALEGKIPLTGVLIRTLLEQSIRSGLNHRKLAPP